MIIELNTREHDLQRERDVRIAFCHSAHDKGFSDGATPNGLRYQADNLAYSTRRRVTICEIAEVTYGEDFDHLPTYTPLVTGVALCHHTDQFVKLRGRGLALSRALACAKHRGFLSAKDVNDIWDAFPDEFNDLQEMESEHQRDRW